MCDFDLSQALDGSPDLDQSQTGCESSCFNMTDVQKEIISLDAGLDLVISRNPKTMRGVVTLVVAVKRLQKSLPGAGSWTLQRSPALSDGDLCRAIMENLVDETLVPTVANVTRERRQMQKYNRFPSTEWSLRDTQKKDIVCCSDRLQAVTLKGGNFDHKVNFKLACLFCSDAGDARPSAQTFCLSIKCPIKNKLYLSCKETTDNNVELHLEEWSDDINRFLFYKRDEGVSLSCFESVLFPGWFISTSETENEPVEMCKVDSAQRVTHFNVTRP